MGKDRSKDGDAATSSATENRDHSRDQESRDAVLARTITVAVAGALAQQKSEETVYRRSSSRGTCKTKAEETQLITEAFTRQMEKTHAQYEKLLKESHAQALPSTLKVTSGTDGFRVMDPFDWKMDKNI